MRVPRAAPAGTSWTLATTAIDAGDAQLAAADLATITVGNGTAAGDPPSTIRAGLPLAALTDYRTRPITRSRTIVFSEDIPKGHFYMNGLLFDPDRIDYNTAIGDLELWTVINNSTNMHVRLRCRARGQRTWASGPGRADLGDWASGE